jgi:uncharacterized membrane protein
MSTHEIIALLLAFLTIAIATAIALYFEKRDLKRRIAEVELVNCFVCERLLRMLSEKTVYSIFVEAERKAESYWIGK